MKALRELVFTAAFVCSVFAQDSGKVFVVRHAEKESQAKDAALSDLGRARRWYGERLGLTGEVLDLDVQGVGVDVRRGPDPAEGPFRAQDRVEEVTVHGASLPRPGRSDGLAAS